MVATLLGVWLAAALGQAPATGAGVEAGWLQAAPSAVDLVIRTRGIGDTRDDLLAALQAASPALADQVRPLLLGGPGLISEQFGHEAATGPLLILLRLPRKDALGTPPYAVFVRSADLESSRRQLAGPGGDPKPVPQEGGFDAIKGADGLPIYLVGREGYLVFGNDEFLMKAVARPEQSLGARLGADLQDRLLEGDVGLFADLASLRDRYGDQLEALRGSLRGRPGDEPRPAAPTLRPATATWNEAIADAIEDGRAVALGLDFRADGLTVSGEVVAEPGSATARLIEVTPPTPAEAIGRLPEGLTSYFYLRSGPEAMAMLQAWGLSNLFGRGVEAPPPIREALDRLRPANLREMAIGSAMKDRGIRGLTLATYDDPGAAVRAMTTLYEALRADQTTAAVRAIKSVEVQPDAREHRGFRLARATITWDLDRIAALRPEVPNAANLVRAMLGESLTTWFGTDGKVVLSAVAPGWDEAAALIDASATGTGSLAETPAFRSLRPTLLPEVNGMLLVNAQGYVRQFQAQVAGMLPDDPNLKPLDAMPADPVMIGASIRATPAGLRFRSVLPTALGPIIEKGFLPQFQGLSGRPRP